ncbi:MAG: tetratricopeptide repeat protein [Candidatus Eisenbacteria bacterium]|nr:tetratricopeptide repeat protein [Candidatus Eisenbacteria bacterium]
MHESPADAPDNPRSSTSLPADALIPPLRALRWSYPSSSGAPLHASLAREAWVVELVERRDEIAAAARGSLAQGRVEEAVELAACAWRLWMQGRDVAGGRAFAEEVLRASGGVASAARAKLHYGAGLFAFWQGDVEGSRRESAAALALAEATADEEALTLAHLGLARAALEESDAPTARKHATEARRRVGALAPTLGPAIGQAPLHLYAQAARRAGDLDEAAEVFRESLALNRLVDDSMMVVIELENLGRVEAHRGNRAEAERCLAECAALGGEVPESDPYGRVMLALDRAFLAVLRDDAPETKAILAEIDALLRETGIELASDDRLELEWIRSGGLSPA